MQNNNKYGKNSGCPAKMDDSRIFTNYLSATRVNEYIKNLNNITDNDEYRLFLQKNSQKIINKEREFAAKNKLCDLEKLKKNGGLSDAYPIDIKPSNVMGIEPDTNASEIDETGLVAVTSENGE